MTKTKTIIRSITALAAILTVTSAMAAAGQSPLANCYDLVIDSCNQGDHPVPCAENGMDQCDEVYGAQIHTGGLNFAANPPAPTRKLMLIRR